MNDNFLILYDQYLSEREGNKSIFLNPQGLGFAIYQIQDSICYIEDIFVLPEHRKFGIATEMAKSIEELALEQGCKELRGSVVPDARGAHASLLTLLAYGFTLIASSNNFILFSKQIG